MGVTHSWVQATPARPTIQEIIGLRGESINYSNMIICLQGEKYDSSRHLEYRKQYDNKPKLQKILDSIFNLLDKSE
jgi:hypothetical protein